MKGSISENHKPLFAAQKVDMSFGGLRAVTDLNIELKSGELVGLIGPNGAGKTTCFNLFTGVYRPTAGDLFFSGHSLRALSPHQRSRLGIARTFQNIRLFKRLSVMDNVLIAMDQSRPYHLIDSLLRSSRYFDQEQRLRQRAQELLQIFNLQDRAQDLSGGLAYGEQRKLEIVRALATQPKLILLDEPAAGMNHTETDALMHTIAQLRKNFNLSILLIEHDMPLVMGICERIYVLDHGVTIASGSPTDIRQHPKVIEAYLGVAEPT